MLFVRAGVHVPFGNAGVGHPPKRGRAPASEVLRKFCEKLMGMASQIL
jgi:hypothetical protein